MARPVKLTHRPRQWRRIDEITDGGNAPELFPRPQNRPPPPTPTSSNSFHQSANHAQLDMELFRNEQRHMGIQTEEFVDKFVVGGPPRESFLPQLETAVEHRHSHTQQTSSFRLDDRPIEAAFLDWYPKGNASILFHNEDNTLASIRQVNIGLIEHHCPLLAAAFEQMRSGPQLYLEVLTPTTALPFLRFLYTATYSLAGPAGEMYEDVPTSVLLHCQMFRLGDMYNMVELKTQAYVNVVRQCEFGCSSPDKPIDLCAAIRFAYQHLRGHENLIDTLVNYCVACISRHRLAQDPEFMKLSYELGAFQQDMCKNTMDREFKNETAAAIIQMPFAPYTPPTYASRDDAFREDVVFHFHSSEGIEEESPRKRKRDLFGETGSPTSKGKQAELPIRSRAADIAPSADENYPGSDEEEELYRAVRKRRASGESSVRKGLLPVAAAASSSSASVVGLASALDYEVVPKVVSSESDSDGRVIIDLTGEDDDLPSPPLEALPIRSRGLKTQTGKAATLAPAPAVVQVDSDSESEWTVV